jgi:hypothetical protein
MKFVPFPLCTIAVVAQLALASVARAEYQLAALMDMPRSARCASLYGYVTRYEIVSLPHYNTDRRLRADVAAALCEAGDKPRGIPILEVEVRESLLPPLAKP